MKLNLHSEVRLLPFALVGVLLCFETGCKPKTDGAAQDNKLASTNSLVERNANSAAGLALEHDPAKRPLVLSQPASSRWQWVLQILKQGYLETDRTNAEWDAKVQTAFEAFAQYSRISTTNWPQLKQALGAVQASCDDPMIQYMRVRYREQVEPEGKTASDFVRVHEAMVRSHYHPVIKFFAGMRAAEAARAADKHANPKYQIEHTTADLEDLARDTNAPVAEVFEAAGLWLDQSRSKEWIRFVTGDLEPILKRDWGTNEQWFHFEGKAEVWRGWGERGSGWASSVSDKGREGFADHLDKADQFLTKAWQMNSNNADTAYLMMQVELGQGQGRTRMELWFNRTMSLDTNHYDAVKLMSFYLEPRWYGSEAQTLAFARTCVASEKWGGQVPLILANLHRSLATYSQMSNSPAYWHRPEVWRDVKSSYDKFFTSYPDASDWRHNYARDAYDCGQYAVFLEQTKLFTSWTNYSFFGGPEKFQNMLQTAVARRQGE